jgi:hypothetical protein
MINYPENHCCSSFTGISVKQFDAVFKEIEAISKTRNKASFFQKRKKKRKGCWSW